MCYFLAKVQIRLQGARKAVGQKFALQQTRYDWQVH